MARRKRSPWEGWNFDLIPDADYARLSDDKSGEGIAVARQFDINAETAANHGRTLSKYRYDDNSVSAVDPLLYERKAFKEMMVDLREGRVNGIVVYDLDRLFRHESDSGLIKSIYAEAKRQGRAIRPILTKTEVIDPNTESGAQRMSVKSLIGEGEIRAASRRMEEERKRRTASGGMHGGPTPFGWVRVLSDTGSKTRFELDPVRSQAIREAIADILAGRASYADIAVRWNNAGLLTPFAGKKRRKTGEVLKGLWLPSNVWATLHNPRLAGYRTYDGETLINPETGEPVKAVWPAIFTPEEWAPWAEHIAREKRDTSGDVARLLTGILRCAKCGSKMRSGGGRKESTYRCPIIAEGGCNGMSIKREEVDAIVTAAVLAHIEIESAQTKTDDLTALTERVESLKTRHGDLEARVLAAEIQTDAMWQRLNDMARELKDARAELSERKAAAAAAGSLDGNIRARWEESDTRQRRLVILSCVDRIIIRKYAGNLDRSVRENHEKMTLDRVNIIWR